MTRKVVLDGHEYANNLSSFNYISTECNFVWTKAKFTTTEKDDFEVFYSLTIQEIKDVLNEEGINEDESLFVFSVDRRVNPENSLDFVRKRFLPLKIGSRSALRHRSIKFRKKIIVRRFEIHHLIEQSNMQYVDSIPCIIVSGHAGDKDSVHQKLSRINPNQTFTEYANVVIRQMRNLGYPEQFIEITNTEIREYLSKGNIDTDINVLDYILKNTLKPTPKEDL